MKFKILPKIIMLTKLSFKGLLIQCMFLNVLWATDISAQDIKSVKEVYVSMNLHNANLLEVFSEIEKQTDFSFTFSREDLNSTFTVTRKDKKIKVSELLLDISRQTKLIFKQVNKNITVSKYNNSINTPVEVEVIIQTRTITGKVISSENGEGLPGVNVVEKGTSNGTVTDVQGNYSIDVSESATLVFSSVGYNREEIEIGNQSVIDLVMTADIQQLEELVVVGYGTQKKVNLTGSVETIKEEEIEKQTLTQASQALSGLVSGVSVIQGSGQPGRDETTIRIRGLGTFSGAGNDPLVLIDGLAASINDVNPNDIKSISIFCCYLWSKSGEWCDFN